MIRSWCALIIVCCCMPTLGADDAPATQPMFDAEFIKREVTGNSPRTAERMADVVQLKLEDGLIQLLTNQEPTEGNDQIRIKDRPGFCTIDVAGEFQKAPWTPERLIFKYWNMTRPGDELVHVLFTPVSMQIAHTTERGEQTLSTSLIQGPSAYNGESPGLALIVSGMNHPDGTPARVHVSAPSFEQLLTKYPRETSTYLLPVFQDLRQAKLFAVDSRLAWQVFSDALVPDEKVIEHIRKTIASLDAEAYADREAAYAELQKLGQPAVGWISRMDRSKLSPEQRSRIDEFLASYQPVDATDARSLRTDVHFLLNCFFNEDKAIREQAMKHLKEVTGKPIDLNLELPASELESRVAQLRAQLTKPTTRPAAP